MRHSATRELFAHWTALRGARLAPERGDIDPTAIRAVLADTFMLDVDPAHGFPFRLAGTRVNGLFDAEQKGREFLALWRPAERRNIAAVLMTVADGVCPVVAGALAAPAGHAPTPFELLFLPLRHYGPASARILGLVTAAQRPAWLGLLPAGPLQLTSLRLVEPREAELPTRVAVGQEHLSGPMSFGVVAPRPRLRVIQGGR